MKDGLTKGMVAGLALAVLLAVAFAIPGSAQTNVPGKKVNLNTASLDELQQLPRIGPKVAQRIIDFRSQNGKFKKIEEIMKVKGIGEKTFQRIKDLITVGEATTSKEEKGI